MKHNYEPEEKDYSWPDPGTSVTAVPGGELLVQGTRVSGMALIVREPVAGEGYSIPAGTYPMVGEDSTRLYFAPQRTQASVDSDAVEGLFVPRDDTSSVCVVTSCNGYECYAARAETGVRLLPSDRHIEKSLIFAGRRGDMIDLVYRERRGQDILLSYDISFRDSGGKRTKERSVIRYRGAVLAIESCTDRSITCQVISSFTRGEHASQYADGTAR